MKYSQAVTIIAAAFAGSAAAQNLSGLPTCAQAAALAGISSTGCSLTDIACVCKSTKFLESVQAQIKTACSAADQAATIEFAYNLCKSAGVTISTGAAGGAATSSAAESSAAPSSSEAATTSEAAPSSTEMASSSEAAPSSTEMASSSEAASSTEMASSSEAAATTSAAAMPTYPAGNGTVPVNGTSPGQTTAVTTGAPAPTYSSGAIAQAGSFVFAGAIAAFAAFAL